MTADACMRAAIVQTLPTPPRPQVLTEAPTTWSHPVLRLLDLISRGVVSQPPAQTAAWGLPSTNNRGVLTTSSDDDLAHLLIYLTVTKFLNISDQSAPGLYLVVCAS